MKEYDVIVLGAGPGGYVSAIRAAQCGAKTAIIEKAKVGGTCLNAGCIPTKALLRNVEILDAIAAGKKRGIKINGEIELNYAKAIKAKNKAVSQLVSGVIGLLAANGVDKYEGQGNVQDAHTIEVKTPAGECEKLAYQKLIVATGSVPAIPPIKGFDLPGVISSEEILQMESVPQRLTIIGGGVIGCEIASVMRAYGSEVTIIEMLSRLAPMLDSQISEYMAESFQEKGITLMLQTKVESVEQESNGTLNVQVTAQDGTAQSLAADRVLVSVGRRPNLCGVEKLNLKTDRGFIVVNDKLETSIPNIYAIGDVASKVQLAHVASEMGIVAAENAAGANKTIDLSHIPSCIYTIPEISSVGLTEEKAKEAGYDPVVGIFPLSACGKAVAVGEDEGFFKIVADKSSRKILGAHLVGKSATELIAEICAYLKMGATIDDITDTIHAHPTIAEAIAEAARNIDGMTIHMPNKK